MIPHLKEPRWRLEGKLQGKLGVRLASGTEVAGVIADIEAVVVVEVAADAAEAEAYIPGAQDALELSVGVGEDGDGKRAPDWRPVRAACQVEIADGEGAQLYAGDALVRSARLRTHEEGGALTVALRLLDVSANQVSLLVAGLGESLSVEGVWSGAVVGAGAQPAQVPGGLPFPAPRGQGSLPEVGLGDIVVAAIPIGEGDGSDVLVGLVVATAPESVALNTSLSDETAVVHVPLAYVETVTAIAGPRGGDARPAIVELREDAAEDRDWSDVLDALGDPDEDGRCRLTRAVRDAVAAPIDVDPLPDEV